MAIKQHIQIETIENKIEPPPFPRGQGRDGYGRKITTDRMVKIPGSNRWRRVYCCIFSNIGTCYVPDKNGDWIVIY